MDRIETAAAELRRAMEAHRAEGGEFAREEWGIEIRRVGDRRVLVPTGDCCCAIGAWISQMPEPPEVLDHELDEDMAAGRIAQERLGFTQDEVRKLISAFDDEYSFVDHGRLTGAAKLGSVLAEEFVGHPYDEEIEEEDEPSEEADRG